MWAKFQSLCQETATPQAPQGSPYLTREDKHDILFQAKKMESVVYVDTRPPYVNVLTTHFHDHELRLREFSKYLEGQAFTWYTSLTPIKVSAKLERFSNTIHEKILCFLRKANVVRSATREAMGV